MARVPSAFSIRIPVGGTSGKWSPAVLMGAGALEPEATALIAAMTVQPDAARQALINNLISTLKAAGIWTKIDFLYVLAAHDGQAGRINWKTAANVAAETNGPAFVLNRGYNGNPGASAYLNTGLDWLTLAGYKQNDGCAGIWVVTEASSAGSQLGGLATNRGATLGARDGSGNAVVRMAATTGANIAIASSAGHLVGNRNNAANFDAYKNGSLLGNQVIASLALVTDTVTLLRTSGSFSAAAHTLAIAHGGASLTSTQIGQLYAAFGDYLQAVGAVGAPLNSVAPVVSGTPTEGQVLTTTNGTWLNIPTSFAYQWFRHDGVTKTPIAGETSNSFTLTAAGIGRNVGCDVTASNAFGSTTQASNQVGPILSGIPANTVAPAISGTTTQGSTLATSNGTWTNSPSSFTYAWFRIVSGVKVYISLATAGSYVLAAGDVGLLIGCDVTASNAFGTAAAAASNQVGPIAALPVPVNSVAPVVSGTAAQGQVLTSTSGTWSNSPTAYAYQWMRAGAAIAGATSSTYALGAADVGSTIRCDVIASNPGGSSAAVQSNTTATVVGLPANSVAPAVTGTTAQGSTLSTSNGTWSGSPSFTYQWFRVIGGDQPIVGATAATYVLVAGDVGLTIGCIVTGTNAAGAVNARSNVVGPITGIPILASPPVVSGTTMQGDTVSTTNGSWTNSPTSFAYQWFRHNGTTKTTIAGATAGSYTLASGDVGQTVGCDVTASNVSGASSPAESNKIGPVTPLALAPVNTVAPVMSGTENVGATLSTTNGSWTNSPSSFAYQWFRVDPVTEGGALVTDGGLPVWTGAKTTIAGATASNYTLQAADAGKLVGCDVTASNASGSNTAQSNVTGMIGGTLPFADAYLSGQEQNINAAPDGSNNYTFATVTIGSADSRRKVLLQISTSGGTAALHNSLVASGGITFTKLVNTPSTANANMTSLWQADVPSGTTLTGLVLNCSAAPARVALRGWVHGRGSVVNTFANFAAAVSVSGSIDVPANGALFAGAHQVFAGATTNTFTGLPTEDIDSNSSSTLSIACGRYANTGGAETARSVATTWTSGNNCRLVVAAFGAQT